MLLNISRILLIKWIQKNLHKISLNIREDAEAIHKHLHWHFSYFVLENSRRRKSIWKKTWFSFIENRIPLLYIGIPFRIGFLCMILLFARILLGFSFHFFKFGTKSFIVQKVFSFLFYLFMVLYTKRDKKDLDWKGSE